MGRHLIEVQSSRKFALWHRLLEMLGALWLLYTLSFFLLRFFPGSPFDSEMQLQPSVELQLQKAYGLDKSWTEQYWIYLQNILSGRWGASQFFENRSVEEIITRSAGNTAVLVLGSLAIAFLFSLILAISAQRSRSAQLRFEVISLGILSLPTLLVAPLCIFIFGFQLNLLPVALLEKPSSYLLPIFVLSLKPLAGLSRLLEVQIRKSMSEDDVRFLRACGISENKILLKYALKKSLGPFLSYGGQMLAVMLAGSTMVEIIFAIPGLGSQFLEAVLNRDSTLVLGLTLFLGFSVLIGQCLIDLGLIWLDPRPREAR